jgi:hypothetical protein
VHAIVRFLAAFMGVLSLNAIGAIEFLPGSSPQSALRLQPFPNPIRVRVTDGAGNPATDASVRWFLPYGSFLNPATGAFCIFDLGYSCSARTNADGIADILIGSGAVPGMFPIDLRAEFAPGAPAGVVTLVLTVEPLVPPAKLTLVSGSGQRVPRGTPFSQPLVVRMTTPSGDPVVGARVAFYTRGASDGVFAGAEPGTFGITVPTDISGFAVAAFTPTTGIGEAAIVAAVQDAVSFATLTVNFEFTSTTADGATELDLQDMWWSGFDENGWGMSVAQREDRLFSVVYAYDDQGKPTWSVFPSIAWPLGYRYERGISLRLEPRGSPYFAYDVSRFVVGPYVASLDFIIANEQLATLEFSVPYPGKFQKTIRRQDFTSDTPAPLQGLAGMWWGGPSQAGWGMALMEQSGGLFSVWLTYDENGDRTWFVMPSGTWVDANTYEGTIYKTRSSRWYNTPYDASQLQVTAVGTFRYRFSDVDNATFEYTAEGYSGTLSLMRQLF